MPRKSAEERIRKAVDEAETFDDCPVLALGESVEGGTFYFLSRSGKVRVTTHRDLTRSGIDSLFVGDPQWLVQNHAQLDRKGKPTTDWDADKCRSDLLRRCDAAGYFDPDRQIRGPGAWLDDEAGLIIHCGDRVLIGEQWRDAGFRRGRFVYPTSFQTMKPPAKPATAAEVQALLEFLGRWNWRWSECAPRLVLGWIFGAMMCGALRWRPHIWVTGGKHHGKSTLESLIFGILNEMLYRASDPSGPGIRNSLNGAAMPVALDEIEFDSNNRRAQDVVELARLGSTDQQGAVVRADPNGGSHAWFIRACFYFTSIIHAPLKPQDRDRITVLELDRLDKNADKRFVLDQIERFSQAAPAFHARMIQSWDRFQVNALVYEEALFDKFNYRVADQFGTMLAVAETMLNDDPADPEEVAEFLRELDLEPNIQHAELDDPEDCLTHLLSWPTDLWRSGERHTMGSLIEVALQDQASTGETKRALPKTGVTLRPSKGAPMYLAVANNHNNLERMFAETRFAQRGWIQVLRRIEGAFVGDKVINFAGVRSRAVLVPLSALKSKDDEDEGT